MQNPKPRSSSAEVPRKVSPRATRPQKLNPPEFSNTSPGVGKGTPPKDKSPKVADRKSPRSPVSEKKRLSRVSELESRISQIQEDLKKVKDELNASEASKKEAEAKAEELKREVLVVSSKLDESQQQISDLLATKEAKVIELRSISEENDQAWRSQLEAVQRQHSVDKADLASALDEIQKLKLQLEMVAESQDGQSRPSESAEAEIQSLREKLAETLILVESTGNELVRCKESAAEAKEIARETLLQLESANEAVNDLRLDSIRGTEAYNSISAELERSRAHASSLEGLVQKLKSDLAPGNRDDSPNPGDNQDTTEAKRLDSEIAALKTEVGRLKSALEAAEIRRREEQARSNAEAKSVQELMEQTNSSSRLREAELEEELVKAKAGVAELRASLMEKETELQGISEENRGLNAKLEKDHELEKELIKLGEDAAGLKASLMDKETELQNMSEENEMLKKEAKKKETEDNGKVAAEAGALAKLSEVMEEADKSKKRAARVAEQLAAAQAVNAGMESELRRLKVQTDQWRKAAEAAASMLSSGNNNGKFVGRTGSLDGNISPIPRRIISSPDLDDSDDDSPKKKNGNVLKRFGVLWKKPQK